MVSAQVVPEILISLAPPEEPLIEPFSPFSPLSWATADDDGFRPQHLTPPPTNSPRHFAKQLSPLRPAEAVVTGKGLERERFEALLKASRERNSAVGAKKSQDLRKEIALKAHKTKQVERRALFLSKVLAPPSPTAASLPKTPPESPAVFHYSLPSPGLVSPLALFESLANEDPARGSLAIPREPWVEQVDFRLRRDPAKSQQPTTAPHGDAATVSRAARSLKSLPSLDQISARLSSQGHVHPSSKEPEAAQSPPQRLPAFLQRAQPEPQYQRPRLMSGVGRLKLPVHAPKPMGIAPPASPQSPLTPNLQITTLVVPRSASRSPTELNESNLLALNSRARRSKDMLSTIKRRTLSMEYDVVGCDAASGNAGRDQSKKRHSAPAELQHASRLGFEHPVFSLPGGF